MTNLLQNAVDKVVLPKQLTSQLNNANTIVTRFPPEPSGYLHLGHLKALFINWCIAQKFGGKMIYRLDDTNPELESTEYADAITEDILSLGFVPHRVTRSSDYFDLLLSYADTLVQNGHAYVDNTEPETMKLNRQQGIASDCRDMSPDHHMDLWTKLKTGKITNAVLRLKMDMAHTNAVLRDPTAYRWQGDGVYPTYDYSCPIVDSIEGVTHVFRSVEFSDRDAQYKWVLKLLNLKCPLLFAYSKVTFEDTLMSKRKIKKQIADGLLNGWDDPRLLTIRGVLRRGMCMEALFDWVISTGFGKNQNCGTTDKLWSINRKIIDRLATRYTVLSHNVKQYTIVMPPNYTLPTVTQIARFKRNPDLGTRLLHYSDTILIDLMDANTFVIGEKITLMNWGNAMVTADNELTLIPDDTNYKGTKKIIWLPNDYGSLVVLTIVDYESNNSVQYLGEQGMEDIQKGEYIQCYNMGHQKCDSDNPLVFIQVPDGKNG